VSSEIATIDAAIKRFNFMWVTSGKSFRNELGGEYQWLRVTGVTLSGEVVPRMGLCLAGREPEFQGAAPSRY
jgi:hypothetical protein